MQEPIENGFYKIDNESYHAGPGISRSYLHKMIEFTPAHAILPVEPTPMMQFGTDFHTAILEPARFDQEYVVIPPDCRVGSGTGQKSRLADFMQMVESSGQTVIKQEDIDKIHYMRDAVFSHPLAKELLSNGEAELSGYWTDKERGNLLCKCRMDYINKTNGIILDLKKTADARRHIFTALAYRLGYHMEAAWYLYGATQITRIEHKDFYFIACEDTPPWGVIVYKADDEMVNEGLIACAKAVALHNECVKNNHWPCYSVDLQELSLPGWVKRKQDIAIYD